MGETSFRKDKKNNKTQDGVEVNFATIIYYPIEDPDDIASDIVDQQQTGLDPTKGRKLFQLCDVHFLVQLSFLVVRSSREGNFLFLVKLLILRILRSN